MKLLVFVCALYLFSSLLYHEARSQQVTGNDSEPALFNNQSYCFEFTWLGPEYDRDNGYNGTCKKYLDENRAKNVPCSPPFVITYDSTPPDINYLWKNHRTSVLCRKSRTQVCARYTYYSANGLVNNQTFMCTKVEAVGEGSVNEGCYIQKKDGINIEICICNQGPGIVKPCNDGCLTKASILIVLLCCLFKNWHTCFVNSLVS